MNPVFYAYYNVFTQPGSVMLVSDLAKLGLDTTETEDKS